jgi:hypothetical protein
MIKAMMEATKMKGMIEGLVKTKTKVLSHDNAPTGTMKLYFEIVLN